jgi:hypothetical protein
MSQNFSIATNQIAIKSYDFRSGDSWNHVRHDVYIADPPGMTYSHCIEKINGEMQSFSLNFINIIVIKYKICRLNS